MFSEYRLKRRVQFYETDAAGIVHFSWFFRYMEEAEHALWREAGLSIAPPGRRDRLAARRGIVRFPRARCRFEQEFEVWIRIAAMTAEDDPLHMRAAPRRDEDRHRARMTVACVRTRPNEPMRSIDIPPEIAERFQVAPGRRRLSAMTEVAIPPRGALRSPRSRRTAGTPARGSCCAHIHGRNAFYTRKLDAAGIEPGTSMRSISRPTSRSCR